MILCNDPPFVFYAVPRTASRAISAHLLKCFPGKARAVGRHHAMHPLPDTELHFAFAVVRNPFARHLSHYLFRRSRPRSNMYRLCRRWTFREYLEWDTNMEAPPLSTQEPPQATMLSGCRLHRVLRFESLQDEFDALPFMADAKFKGPIKQINHNRPYRLADYYDAYCMRLVRDFAAIDFAAYGYDPERLPDE